MPFGRGISGEVLWIGAGQAAAVMGTLAGVRLLTEVLPPEDYGRVAIGMTIVSLSQLCLMGPVGSVAQRFFSPSEEASQLGAFIHGIRRYTVRAGAVMAAVSALAVATTFVIGAANWAAIFGIAAVLALLVGSNAVLSGIQNAARQRKVVALHRALDQWLRYAVALGLVLLFEPSAWLVLVGFSVAVCVVLASQANSFVRLIRPRWEAETPATTAKINEVLGRMFRYGWPFAVWGVFGWGQSVSDKWALEAFGSTADVGLYAPLYQLGFVPVILVTNVSMQFIQPILFGRAGDGSDPVRVRAAFRLNYKMLGLAVALTVLGVGVWTVFHRPLFSLFVAEEYAHVSYLMPFMMLSGGLYVVGQVASASLLIELNTQRLVVPRVTTGVIGMIAHVVGAANWGLEGVVAGHLVYGLLFLLWMLCYVAWSEARLRHRILSAF